MKSAFINLFVVLCLVYCCAQLSNGATPCGTVNVKAASCATYAMGRAPTPSKECCTGLQQLASNAKTVDDKKAICRCLKAAVKNFAGVQDKYLSKIPAFCGINVGFPSVLLQDPLTLAGVDQSLEVILEM